MKDTHIPYYDDFISPELKNHILKEARAVAGIPDLLEVGSGGGLETEESFKFLVELFEGVRDELQLVLDRRIRDRKFIDERVRACATFNRDLKRDFLSSDYKTVMGIEDGEGRIVVGPKTQKYCESNGKPIAQIGRAHV